MSRKLPPVVILTDFGSSSPFPGIMKGVMLSINPELKFIDLSNDISPYNIREAYFVLKHSYCYFPEGTVFLVVVDPGVGGNRKAIIVKTTQYLFVAPDNGVVSFLFNKNPQIFEITYSPPGKISRTFHGRDIFAPVAAYLASGVSVDELGKLYTTPVKLEIPEPQIQNEIIKGSIVYVDRFGNCITNIEEKMVKGMPEELRIKGHTITRYVNAYSEAPRGEPLLIFNSFGLLEIAINQGNASRILGIKEDDEFTLVISPISSSQTPPERE